MMMMMMIYILILSISQKDIVIALMGAGWSTTLKDNTGLTPKDMADVALWNERGDITILFV